MELNSQDWSSGPDGEERAKQRRRRTSFISNVLVLKHDARPDDVGKVFLWAYPKTVFEMALRQMRPVFKDVDPYLPFDLETGANFRLKILNRAGFPNYEDSRFDTPSELTNGQTYKDAVYSLAAEIAPDKFEDYDVLKNHLERALGLTPARGTSTPMGTSALEQQAPAPTPVVPRRPSLAEEMNDAIPDGDDTDEGEAFFQNVANSVRQPRA